MSHPRVFVTGIGLISPLGIDTNEHFQRLFQGESGIKQLTQPDYGNFPCQLQAKVREFNKREKISNRMLRKLLTPSATFALVAAGQTIQDGKIEQKSELLKNCGLYVGSLSLDIKPELFTPAFKESLGKDGQFDTARFATRGTRFLDPLFLVKLLPNGGLCGIAIEYQVNGPNCNITNGTVSGLQAVIMATSAIQRGELDIAIAGGYDSLLQMDSILEHTMSGRLALRNDQPEKACRPFDTNRDGYVLGEGAAFFLLESESHASNRSARVYGEIISSGQNTNIDAFLNKDLYHKTLLAHAAQCALEKGNCKPTEVDVIYGDGLAIEDDDLMEANAYKRLFSDNTTLFTAATGSLGFIGTASGTFSLAHALAGIRRNFVFPMINCDYPDPRCALPFVHTAQNRQCNRALVWNSDRGVKNVAVLVGRV